MWSKSLSPLLPLYWWSEYLSGVAMSWAVRMAPPESLRSHGPMPVIRTPLLRLCVETLKPNPHAGQRKPCEMKGGRLHLVPHD